MNYKKLLYIFTSFAVAFVLFVLGFFALTPKEIEVSSPQSSLSGSECVGAACGVEGTDKLVSLEGTVRVLQEGRGQDYGTHQLEDNTGKVLAILKTDDDKLKMVEGAWVEIRGKTVRGYSQGVPIVEVEEISFKK